MEFDIRTNTTEFDSQLLREQFFRTFPNFSDADARRFSQAWDFLVEKAGGLSRSCGNPYYLHPMRVASILADASMDMDCVVCGLLHSIFDLEGVSEEEVKGRFGDTICKIVRDTSRITGLKINATTLQQADAIRKMLFAMIDDIRVILVKLADRLDRMRNLKSIEPKKQRLVASEVMDIWAPLADRLGMQNVKSELEDLSLKYANPDVFQQINRLWRRKRANAPHILRRLFPPFRRRP